MAVLAALSYVGLAMAWHVDPPFTAVRGTSMEPFLVTGDLVLLHGVDPATLKKGDVIAVVVPKQDRTRYNLPGQVVHRIIAIHHTREGLVFQTKGDNNPGPDVFQTPAANVIGEMTGKVPYLGYPLLFFKSRQGYIFLLAVAGVVLLYLLLGFFDQRREADPRVVLMESVLDETRQLRADVAALGQSTRPRAPPSAVSDEAARETAPQDDPGELLRRLTEAVTTSVEATTGTARSSDELVAAVSEYGEHLKSHTAAVQSMAAAAAGLEASTAAFQNMLSGRAVTGLSFPLEAAGPFGPHEATGAAVTVSEQESTVAARSIATREVRFERSHGFVATEGEIAFHLLGVLKGVLAEVAFGQSVEVEIESVSIGADAERWPVRRIVIPSDEAPGPVRKLSVRVEDWSRYGLLLAACVSDPEAPPLVVSLGGVRSRAAATVGSDGSEGLAIVEAVVVTVSIEWPAAEVVGSAAWLLSVIADRLEARRPKLAARSP